MSPKLDAKDGKTQVSINNLNFLKRVENARQLYAFKVKKVI